MDFFAIEYIDGYLSRNKKLFLIAISIFIFGCIVGVIWGYISVGGKTGQITLTFLNSSPDVFDYRGNALNLFIHNLFADLIIYAGAFLFSIISVGCILYNAVSISIPFGQDFVFAFLSIVPHGIFEYSSSILSLVGAFLITKMEIHYIKLLLGKSSDFDVGMAIKDLALTFSVNMVLLLIAAFVEAYFTPMVISLFFWGVI